MGSMKKKGRTLIVGVKLSTASREVLTWALLKEARPGDRVIALHVVSMSSVSVIHSKKQQNCVSQVSRTFDALISVYHGFCNLKQVELEVKISYGQLRKVLLEETKHFQASKLILGTSKKNAIVSPIALAKYCAQRLPSNTSIIVVNRGKLAFVKDGAMPSPERGSIADSSVDSVVSSVGSVSPPSPNGKSTSTECQSIRRSVSSVEGLMNLEPDEKPNPNDQKFSAKQYVGRKCLISPAKVRQSKADISESQAFRSFFGHKPFVPLVKSGEIETEFQKKKKDSPNLEQKRQDTERLSTKVGFNRTDTERPRRVKESPNPAPNEKDLCRGWPLMLRQVFVEKVPPLQESNPEDVPVVEWALNLPNRQPDSKDEKQDAQSGGTELNLSDAANDLASVTSTWCDENDVAGRLNLISKGKDCRHFKYEVLEAATSKFSEENLVGKGGSSKVYRGTLPDGRLVAVKVLSSSSEQVEQEMLSEVEIITSLHHKNIIVLAGYCTSSRGKFLVYDFVSKGNLEENLHAKKDKPVVQWTARMKIAVGVAEALAYLHEGCPRAIVHRDVKSSNILLFDDFEPQLSDFGLAKWADSSSPIICNDVVGTFGYLAPEYFMYGRVTEKTDVFSFGVILVELMTGKYPIGANIASTNGSLISWARPLLENRNIEALADPRLDNVFEENEMQRMMIVASMCTRRSARLRPTMSRVLKLLRGEELNLSCWAPDLMNLREEFYDEGECEDEVYGSSDIRNHLSLALLGVDFSTDSFDSTDQTIDLKSWKEYLVGRYSRSQSFE
eukprot:TRINITY_DN17294_c0_g1_i1.p1 TRINITY_DN17294_c0_g1~~TRINITY_DN17294_c0_g1_i1.p1  ORF type:complete len:786 (-),score=117.28 TRINITY_DN17294_c0_g1_i1:470-2827(-)